jgi:hypothetical protein
MKTALPAIFVLLIMMLGVVIYAVIEQRHRPAAHPVVETAKGPVSGTPWKPVGSIAIPLAPGGERWTSGSDTIHYPGTIHYMQTDLAPCPEEAQRAVLDKLWPVLEVGDTPTFARLDRLDSDILCIREWAKSLQDACVRNQYFEWLNDYERRSQAMRRDLATGGPVSDADKWDAEQREKRCRTREYEAAHPVPSPPACSREIVRQVKPRTAVDSSP